MIECVGLDGWDWKGMIRLDGLIGLGCLGKIGRVGMFVKNLRERLWWEGLGG